MDRPLRATSRLHTVTYDAGRDCLHITQSPARLETMEQANACFANLSARIRTFELPADFIVSYDHLHVALAARASFADAGRRCMSEAARSIYRYAATSEGVETYRVTTARVQIGESEIFPSYDAALARLLADRSSTTSPRAPRHSVIAQLGELRASKA